MYQAKTFRNDYKILIRKIEDKITWKIYAHVRTIKLMINLKEMSGCGLAPTGSGQGLTVKFCERGNYILCHASGRKFIGWINNRELSTRKSTAWN